MRINQRIRIMLFLFLLFPLATSSSQQQINASKTPSSGSHLEIHVINVGQGDSFLIISPAGKRILIDAGNNGKGTGCVLPLLGKLHITSLDYVIASHYHSDHIGGLDEVVNGLGGNTHVINNAYDRGGSYRSQIYTDYINAIGNKRATLSADQVIKLDAGVTIACIASNGYIHNSRVYASTDENTLSVVFVLKYHAFQMYFGGDSNFAIEPFLAAYAGDVDVYKVSHHGSSTSSSQQLLDHLKPEVSIIPVGDGNTYGHPDSRTVSRLVNMNSYVYQTETGSASPPSGKGEVANGNFKIVTDGYSYTISGASLVPITRPTDSAGTLEDGLFDRNSASRDPLTRQLQFLFHGLWQISVHFKVAKWPLS